MATILLVPFFTIFFYHRETASDGYNTTGTIFHHFFTTGRQPVMATIQLPVMALRQTSCNEQL